MNILALIIEWKKCLPGHLLIGATTANLWHCWSIRQWNLETFIDESLVLAKGTTLATGTIIETEFGVDCIDHRGMAAAGYEISVLVNNYQQLCQYLSSCCTSLCCLGSLSFFVSCQVLLELYLFSWSHYVILRAFATLILPGFILWDLKSSPSHDVGERERTPVWPPGRGGEWRWGIHQVRYMQEVESHAGFSRWRNFSVFIGRLEPYSVCTTSVPVLAFFRRQARISGRGADSSSELSLNKTVPSGLWHRLTMSVTTGSPVLVPGLIDL